MTQNNVILFPLHRVRLETAGEATSSTLSNNQQQAPAPIFEIQKYLPSGKQITLIEASRGTHQIPHKIFEFMVKATTSRVEMAVFACLVRYTLGFHRPSCEASHSFISEWTGLSIASIRRGLEALLATKLIQCIESGHSFKGSTIYEIPVVKAYLDSTNASRQNDKSLPTGQNEKSAEPKSDLGIKKSDELCLQEAQYRAPSVHSTLPPVGTKKDNTNISKQINTHSQSPTPEYLKNYLSTIKPEQKKKKELGHFMSLREDYRAQDISDSLQLLIEEGIPGSGVKCHSPMAFMACSMDSLLSIVNARREKIRNKLLREQAESEKQRLEAQKEAEEEARIQERKKLFEATFPTPELQEAFLSKFAAKYPFFPKNSYALKNAAISEWASQIQA